MGIIYDELDAGREMDAEVARLVFQRKVEYFESWQRPYFAWSDEMPLGAVCWASKPDYYEVTGEEKAGCKKVRHIPNYSTDINAAWEVIEILRSSGHFCCVKVHSDFHYNYDAVLIVYRADEDGGHSPDYISTADTAPLAICRAALKAAEDGLC